MTQSPRTKAGSTPQGGAQRAPSGPASRPGQSPPARRRSAALKAVAIWSGVAVASVAIAATTFILVAAPTDLVRDQLIQQVRDKTGREIYIAGPTSLRIFPRAGVTIEKVSLSSPPTMGSEPMARVGKISAEVPLWPLLRGHVQIKGLVLHDLELTLRIDKEGRRNWDFARAHSPAPQPAAIRAGFLSAATRERPLTAGRVAIGNLRIEDGTIRMIDDRRRTMEEVSRVNVDVRARPQAGPVEVAGDFLWRRERMRVSASLGSLKNVLDGADTSLALRVTGKPLALDYDGTIRSGLTTDLSGSLTLNASSVRDAAAWLGQPSGSGDSLGPLKLAARLETGKETIRLADTTLSIGDLTATGTVVIDRHAAARPRISADLHVNEIDINRWLRHGESDPPRQGRRQAKKDRAGTGAVRSIDDLIQRDQDGGVQDSTIPAPQVRGFVARNGWSEVDFDLSILRLADADARLVADRVLYHDMKTGQARISATLDRGVLKATVDDLVFYEGRGRGVVVLNAAAGDATVQASLLFEGVSGRSLLKDAADFDWISGSGQLSLAVAGRGRNERQIIETLDGTAAVSMRDGALIGYDIPQMIRSLHRGRLPRFDRRESDKTEFSELAATFKIEKGTATNTDLRLASPLLRVTGSGTAVLPERTIDYTVRPKLMAMQDGQGQSSGFELPVRIAGPWDRPTVTPELNSVVNDPGQALEAAKEIGRQLKGKNVDEIVRDLLGNGEADGSTRQKARDALRQLLRP